MPRVHWAGTGLSAIPGLRDLLAAGRSVTVWNRTLETARAAVGDLTDDIRAFTPEALEKALGPGDVVVSMLPADMHVPLARAALARGAHFVSSSYVAPDMAALDGQARAAGLSLVNEVGLDPGIDHLMAHLLVEAFRAEGPKGPDLALSFISYCGGIPKEPNAFRYKFSWSPLGVLRALRSPSRAIADFAETRAERPWHALSQYQAPLPVPETFEVYPNRDSLPFMAQYGFDPSWRVRQFVRGTLRLEGWAEAWSDVFAEIERLDGAEGEARLAEMSRAFWAAHAYGEGEPDRVVLCVGLKAEAGDQTLWHRSWVLDAWGDARGSAMARLVSGTVALAVESVLEGRIAPGVSAAPADPALAHEWLGRLSGLAQHLSEVDHLENGR
ncbi:MAG: saccharopine dehydrogenase NADP-binding domain-containing protein [Rhodobacteraceae bacterium]|nr:saccharopine dehydrogenase NADP-binding domain-containing protein [Paracoccaceae bacterium]